MFRIIFLLNNKINTLSYFYNVFLSYLSPSYYPPPSQGKVLFFLRIHILQFLIAAIMKMIQAEFKM